MSGRLLWEEICEAFQWRGTSQTTKLMQAKATGLLALGMSAKWAEQPKKSEAKWEEETLNGRKLQMGQTSISIYKLSPNFWLPTACARAGETPMGPLKKAAARN